MRKILLLTAMSAIFISCYRIREGGTVYSVKNVDDKVSLYKALNGHSFYARKGLYNVGDTIKFTK